MADITLHKPLAGEVVFVHPHIEDTLSLAFDPSEVRLERHGHDLILSFQENSQDSGIIMSDFYSTYTLNSMPECIFEIVLSHVDDDILWITGQEDSPHAMEHVTHDSAILTNFSTFAHSTDEEHLPTLFWDIETQEAHAHLVFDNITIENTSSSFSRPLLTAAMANLDNEEDMDILLAGVTCLENVTGLLQQGTFEHINNAHLIVFSDKISANTADEVLTSLNLVKDGKDLKQGEGSSWTDNLHSNVEGYRAYTNDQDITILLKSTLLDHS